MKKFVIASLAVLVVLAGSAVFAHQAMHHMIGMHMETKQLTEAIPSDSMMEHHGVQSMKNMTDSCQKIAS